MLIDDNASVKYFKDIEEHFHMQFMDYHMHTLFFEQVAEAYIIIQEFYSFLNIYNIKKQFTS